MSRDRENLQLVEKPEASDQRCHINGLRRTFTSHFYLATLVWELSCGYCTNFPSRDRRRHFLLESRAVIPLHLLTKSCAVMPFTTKDPSHYLESLSGTFSSSLHIGLYLSGDVDDARASDYAALGKAIRKTKRPIRCLWLRFKNIDESLVAAFHAFGDELSGATTAIQSLVIEGEEVRTDEVMCLLGMLEQNILCGIQFRRTSVDRSTFNELNASFLAASNLKVVDLSCNNNIDDDCITDVLGALSSGRARIESFCLCERNIEGGQSQESSARISGKGVAKIASFVYKSACFVEKVVSVVVCIFV